MTWTLRFLRKENMQRAELVITACEALSAGRSLFQELPELRTRPRKARTRSDNTDCKSSLPQATLNTIATVPAGLPKGRSQSS